MGIMRLRRRKICLFATMQDTIRQYGSTSLSRMQGRLIHAECIRRHRYGLPAVLPMIGAVVISAP